MDFKIWRYMGKCLACYKELINSATRKINTGKYCNNVCQGAHYRQKRIKDFLDGKYANQLMNYPTNSWTRGLLIDKLGFKCNCCGISEWNSKPITLEVNHKDGNAANNLLENLEFLCPNCHSQTETYKAKNKNSARAFRRKEQLPC